MADANGGDGIIGMSTKPPAGITADQVLPHPNLTKKLTTLHKVSHSSTPPNSRTFAPQSPSRYLTEHFQSALKVASSVEKLDAAGHERKLLKDRTLSLTKLEDTTQEASVMDDHSLSSAKLVAVISSLLSMEQRASYQSNSNMPSHLPHMPIGSVCTNSHSTVTNYANTENRSHSNFSRTPFSPTGTLSSNNYTPNDKVMSYSCSSLCYYHLVSSLKPVAPKLSSEQTKSNSKHKRSLSPTKRARSPNKSAASPTRKHSSKSSSKPKLKLTQQSSTSSSYACTQCTCSPLARASSVVSNHCFSSSSSSRNDSPKQDTRSPTPVVMLHSLYHYLLKNRCSSCENSRIYQQYQNKHRGETKATENKSIVTQIAKPVDTKEVSAKSDVTCAKSKCKTSKSRTKAKKGRSTARVSSPEVCPENGSLSISQPGSSSSEAMSAESGSKVKGSKTMIKHKSTKKKKSKVEQSTIVWKRKKRKTSTKGGLPRRAKSTYSRPNHPQIRTYRANMPTTSVHKTHSDTSLENGIRNLAISSKSSSAISSKSHVFSRKSSSGSTKVSRSLCELARQISSKGIKNIVVMAGAGISTASGIPDFRSPGTGLYDNLQKYKIPYPQAIFDIDYFESNPKPFYTLAKELYPTGRYRPNYVHYFLRLLQEKGILLRLYTQNIDGLEKMAGIPPEKLVEAHGTFTLASCVRCKQSQAPEQVKDCIFHNKLPRCKKPGCYGLVKPDIVFFGENLPRRFYYYLRDFPQADLLIVMGTSLEVEPFANIVDSTRMYIPRILFNRVAVGPFEKKRRLNDTVAAGDLIHEVKAFVKLLGWSADLEKLIMDEKKRLESLTDLAEGISQEEIIRNQSLTRPLSSKSTVSQETACSSDNADSSSQSESQTSSSSDIKVKRKVKNNVRSSLTQHRTNSRTRFHTPTKPGLKRTDFQHRKTSHSGLSRLTQSRVSISPQPRVNRPSRTTHTSTHVPGLPRGKFNALPKISFTHKPKTLVTTNTKRSKDAESSDESSAESSDSSNSD